MCFMKTRKLFFGRKPKQSVFEINLTKSSDAEFTSDLEAVAATKPHDMKEFLVRLADLHNNKSIINELKNEWL